MVSFDFICKLAGLDADELRVVTSRRVASRTIGKLVHLREHLITETTASRLAADSGSAIKAMTNEYVVEQIDVLIDELKEKIKKL